MMPVGGGDAGAPLVVVVVVVGLPLLLLYQGDGEEEKTYTGTDDNDCLRHPCCSLQKNRHWSTEEQRLTSMSTKKQLCSIFHNPDVCYREVR